MKIQKNDEYKEIAIKGRATPQPQSEIVFGSQYGSYLPRLARVPAIIDGVTCLTETGVTIS